MLVQDQVLPGTTAEPVPEHTDRGRGGGRVVGRADGCDHPVEVVEPAGGDQPDPAFDRVGRGHELADGRHRLGGEQAAELVDRRGHGLLAGVGGRRPVGPGRHSIEPDGGQRGRTGALPGDHRRPGRGGQGERHLPVRHGRRARQNEDHDRRGRGVAPRRVGQVERRPRGPPADRLDGRPAARPVEHDCPGLVPEPDVDGRPAGQVTVGQVHPAAVEGERQVGGRVGVQGDRGLEDRQRRLPAEVGPAGEFHGVVFRPQARPRQADEQGTGRQLGVRRGDREPVGPGRPAAERPGRGRGLGRDRPGVGRRGLGGGRPGR